MLITSYNSTITSQGYSVVTFSHNESGNGGIMHIDDYSLSTISYIPKNTTVMILLWSDVN